MHGGPQGSALNQRLPIRSTQGHTDNTRTALQAATMAFKASSPNPPSPAAQGQARGARTAAAVAEDASRQNLHGVASPSPPEPEVGSVRDKIGLFSANSVKSDCQDSSPGGEPPSLTRSRTPQHIAARLAAGRSPGPKDSTVASRGVSSVQMDVGTRPRSVTAQERASLPAPTPLRRTIPRDTLSDDASKTSINGGDSPAAVKEVARGKESSTGQGISLSESQKLQTQQLSTSDLPGSSVIGEHQPGQTRPALPPRTDTSDVAASAQRPQKGTPALSPPRETNGSSPDRNDISKRAPTSSAASISARSQDNDGSANLDSSYGINEDALSNAIVASTLASTRVSPSKKEVPPPPPPQRRHRSHSLLHPRHNHRKGTSARTSPPHIGLRQTLREPSNSEDDDDESDREPKHKYKKHYIRKHPHKHHEGDRKRWRSEITLRERKRYEGVWAANKNILIPSSPHSSKFRPPFYPADAHEMVLNLVVRDIWSRSRLPTQALEQIWNLVDRQGIGLLTREEFVVGLWLIDQYLKGHKIPPKVPDSIWDGVRHVPGLKPP